MTNDPRNGFNPVQAQTNTVTVLGCIARDPDIKNLQGSEDKMIRITIAGEELIVDEQGKTRRIPFYEQAIFMRKQADRYIAMGLKAGDAVLADGKFVMFERDTPDGPQKTLDIRYGAIRRAIGFDAAERSKDAGGALRLVGGFAKAAVYGKVIGSGADLRYTPNGQPVLNFSVNARAAWKEGDEWVSDAAFVRATVWRGLAEELGKMGISKGMEAYIEGRPSRSSFKKDERTVYKLELEASRVFVAEGLDSAGASTGRQQSLDSLPDWGGFGATGTDGAAGGAPDNLPF